MFMWDFWGMFQRCRKSFLGVEIEFGYIQKYSIRGNLASSLMFDSWLVCISNFLLEISWFSSLPSYFFVGVKSHSSLANPEIPLGASLKASDAARFLCSKRPKCCVALVKPCATLKRRVGWRESDGLEWSIFSNHGYILKNGKTNFKDEYPYEKKTISRMASNNQQLTDFPNLTTQIS